MTKNLLRKGDENMKKLILTLISLVLICGTAVGIRNQIKSENLPLQKDDVKIKEDLLPTPKEPINCESASRYIDDVINRAIKETDSTLIILIKLGKQESSKIAKRRSEDIKIYLQNRGISNFQIAFGENVNESGRFEFYVKGYLLYSLQVEKGKTFNLMGCWIV